MLPKTRPAWAFVLLILSQSGLLAQPADPAAASREELGHWCHTQIIFEEKRAANPGALSPEACDTYGLCDNPSFRDAARPTEQTPLTYIRLYFQVMTQDDGSFPATSEANVASQVAVLNADYLPYRVQFEYDMRFVADTRYRVLDYESEFDQMKQTYAVDPANQVNIYVATVNISGDVFSFGTFPWDGDALSVRGGIVMNRTQFYPYESATLTHELGHNLGLWHTFRGVSETSQCSSCWESVGGSDRDYTGDLCSDTDPTPLNYNCGGPGGVDPCSGLGWGVTDPQNYMSYAPSYCQNEFTLQQAGRFHCWIADRLSGWVIDFDLAGGPNFGQPPLEVSFQGTTERTATGWSWDFGDGGTSDQQNPSHEYITPGYFDVAATIETPDGPYTTSVPGMVSIYADTLQFENARIGDGYARVDVYVRNYLPLSSITIPIKYDGPIALEIDSLSTAGWRTEAVMTASRISWVDVWNQSTLYLTTGTGPYLEPGSGPVLSVYLRDESGGATGETPVIAEDYSSYSLRFATHAGNYVPVDIGGLVTQKCCRGIVGDANSDGLSVSTIGDVSTIIDHLFITGAPLDCYAEADINQSGGLEPTTADITIGDVSMLIDHLFIAGDPLPACL